MLHETVGRYFKAFGDIYLCFRYEARAGFWMRVVEKGDGTGLIDRPLGAEACISGRAIGRTYHYIHNAPWADKSEKHESPCECYCC